MEKHYLHFLNPSCDKLECPIWVVVSAQSHFVSFGLSCKLDDSEILQGQPMFLHGDKL